MSYLHLNGIAVPVKECVPVHQDIASTRGYSPNGLYQLTRNGYARQWKVRSSLLTSGMRLALMELLGHRGDHWRFNVDAADRPIVNGDSAANFYSDKFSPAYNASGLGNDPVAQVESCFGADGALVYDKNGVADRPWAGATGFVRCEPGATNILSANEANPTANGHLANVVGGTHAPDPLRYWQGTGSVAVNCLASDDGVEANGTGVVSTRYVQSVYVRGHVGGEAIKIRYRNGAGTLIDQETYTLPSSTDAWMRCECANTQAADTNVRMQILSNGGAMDFSVAGLQIEAQTAGPATGWIAGGTTRNAGDLQYSNLLAAMTKGITIAAWVKHMKTGSSLTTYVADAGVTSSSIGDRLHLAFTSSDVLVSTAYAAGAAASLYSTTDPGGAIDNAWHHLAAVWDPSVPSLALYKDGAVVATDTTRSGPRDFDPAGITGDFHLGNIASGTTVWAPGPITHLSVLPFSASAEYILAMYNSAAGHSGGSPGVVPIIAHGTALGIGEQNVAVMAQLDGAPHVPWWNGSTFEVNGGELAFTLFEAVKR